MKKMMIAGGVIIAIGLIITLVFVGLNGWRFESEYEMKTFESTEKVTSLDIDFSVGHLTVKYVDSDKITLEYPESKSFRTDCSVSDGKLTVSNGRRHWYNFFGFYHLPATTLSLPKGLAVDLDLEMNAGNVYIEGGEYGNVKIYLNAGNLTLGDSSCASFECKLNAGGADFGNIESDSVYVKLNAGGVNLKDVSCTNMRLELNAGNVSTGKCSLDDLWVKINAGTVNITLDGAQADYSIAVDKNAGSSTISSSHGGAKKITAKINAGDLNAYFSD